MLDVLSNQAEILNQILIFFYLDHEPVNLPVLAKLVKISKRPCFQDIKNSFYWIADMGPEPHQFFFF